MAPRKGHLIRELHASKETWTIVVRVVRKWNVTPKNKPLEVFCINMILIDEEGERIQASVTQKPLLERFRDRAVEGSTVFIANFNVVENNQYKATNHTYKIIFNANTFIDEEKANIPWNSFSFMPISVCLEQEIAPEYLIDVIGVLKSIGKLEEYRTENGFQNKLTLTLADQNGTSIVCVLLGECASNTYYSYLDNERFPLVFVIQLCRLTIDNKEVQIGSSFNATKVWMNPNIKEVSDLIDSAKESSSPNNSCFSQVIPIQTTQLSANSMLRSTKKIMISDIDTMKVGDPFIIECVIEKLETNPGWTYEGCIRCGTKHRPNSKGIMVCPSCPNDMTQTEFKLKAHYNVSDESGNTSVVFFDKHAYEFTLKTASEIKEQLHKENRSYAFPDELEDVVGRKMLLKLKRTSYNLEHPNSSIGVVQYTACQDLLEQFKEASVEEGTNSGLAIMVLEGTIVKEGVNEVVPTASDFKNSHEESTMGSSLSKVEPIMSQDIGLDEMTISQLYPPPLPRGKRKQYLKKSAEVQQINPQPQPSTYAMPNTKPVKIIKQEKP
ncbi:uncharacterized protein LOC129300509 [Prosopis cineraria]|uniref:uncharacterized protein LOC129300509 n=1 Tax=Prosopis cineraria TaxID=364024 RepID=UPI00240FCC7D|nr:uncharacterized protein LOC129300509 [Prosopis cineraria]